MITKKYGQTGIDTTVIYSFEMALENETEKIEDIIELEDIMCGAKDELHTNFKELNIDQKDIALKRLNKLLETYWMYKKGIKCDMCEELSVATTVLIEMESQKNTKVEVCSEHLHMSLNNPDELVKIYFGAEGEIQ